MVMSEGISLKIASALLVVGIVSMAVVVGAPPAAAATLTVNSIGDGGDNIPGNGLCSTGEPLGPGGGTACTLRAAIQEANANGDADTEIHFNIAGTGVKTIWLSTTNPLPPLKGLTIRGYSQPGSAYDTAGIRNSAILRIRLHGDGGGTGLVLHDSDNYIDGLSLTNFDTAILVAGSRDNSIRGNFIGVTPSGRPAGNDKGIDITYGESGIPSNTSISGNVISAGGNGIVIRTLSCGAYNHSILGNHIGTTPDGQGDLGNSRYGIHSSCGMTIIGAERRAGHGNIIAYNGTTTEDGIRISGSTSGNNIRINSIHSNAGLGIDLGPDGVTPNDLGDRDAGANGLQNSPTITSASPSRIEGVLRSEPNTKYGLYFYANRPDDPSEGRDFVGSMIDSNSVETNRHGLASFSFSPEVDLQLGDYVTATATKFRFNETSEFSKPKQVRRASQ